MFRKIIERLVTILGFVGVASIIIMMLSTVADVAGRDLFTKPVLGTIEMNRTMLVFTIFLTLGYCQLIKQHVGVDFFTSRMPLKIRQMLEKITLILALILMGFLTWGATRVAIDATVFGEHETGIIQFPMWPARISLAVGCFILALQYAIDLYDSFTHRTPVTRTETRIEIE